MAIGYRLLSRIIHLLQGLNQFRSRLLALVFGGSVLLAWWSFHLDEASPNRPYGLGMAVIGLLISASQLVSLLLRGTVFVPGWERVDQAWTPTALHEGEGLPGRVYGVLAVGRHRQRYTSRPGGILLDQGLFHVVSPSNTVQIMSGLSPLQCLDWWRRSLEPADATVEVGTLWLAGRPLFALRFHDRGLDAVTIGFPDAASFARVLETARSLRYSVI